MKQKLKKKLYFYVAAYFKWLASKRLEKWSPRVVVITGSTGKTTLLNLLEAQIGNCAKYSHSANSSFGIPFDILGLKRSTLKPQEWLGLLFVAPFKLLTSVPQEKIYIVEADCDRPGEGRFLASLLNPEVTLWQNVSRTHSINFDRIVNKKDFKVVEDAIAYEFGYFVEYTKKLVIVNHDSKFIQTQLNRTKAIVETINRSILNSYTIQKTSTTFVINKKEYSLPVLLPEDSYSAIAMSVKLMEYLELKQASFSKFKIPPGRSSVFAGIKNITIIDSSYNASLSAMDAILSLFEKYPGNKKWVVLGDMVELGHEEREEHEKLASLIKRGQYDKVLLVGPRLGEYTYPVLKKLGVNRKTIETFLRPREALDYVEENLQGGETVLFKGARFLEGIIEHLLVNKKDVEDLPRREKVWVERRKQWDL